MEITTVILYFSVAITFFFGMIAAYNTPKNNIVIIIYFVLAMSIFIVNLNFVYFPIKEKRLILETKTRISQENAVKKFNNLQPGEYKINDYKILNYYPLLRDSLGSITLENGEIVLIPSKKMKVEFYRSKITTRIKNGETVVSIEAAEIENDLLEVKLYEVAPQVFENYAILKILR